ncbi:MAG TPA: hypothetical protein PKE04_01085 [Clostridia bacterium]|nr:hypothetical protein [Clostridia bacterium]
MRVLIITLRFMGVWISILGYVGFFRVFCAIPANASYVFTLSLIGCLVFFAGLAGVLMPGAYLVLVLGYAGLAVVMAKGKLGEAFGFTSVSTINLLFLLWFGITYVSLIGCRLMEYDNFSHWALAVKQLLIANAFPGASDAIIMFKSYPLGTTSFIYFVCLIAGNEDGVMLMAQAMLLMAAFYALFGIINDRRRFLLAALLGMCCAIMTHFTTGLRISNLLVDFLLPLYALAAIANMTASRNNFTMACITSVPVMAFLLIIKSSGLFFAIPCFAYLMRLESRAGKKTKDEIGLWLLGILAIVAALSTTICWNVHNSLTFANDASKFSYNLKDLSVTIIYKTPEEMQAIVRLFLQEISSLTQPAVQGVLLFNIQAVVVWLNARFGFSMRWKLLRMLLICDGFIALYYVGMLIFYLFLMPLDEAMRMAGFDRYATSILLFLIGMLAMRLIQDVEGSFFVKQGKRRDIRAFKSIQSKRIYQATSFVCCMIAGLFLLTDLDGMRTLQKAYPQSLPAKAEAVLGNQWSALDENRYLLYASDTDRQVSDYLAEHVGRYLLFAPNVQAVSSFSNVYVFANRLSAYDYFVILESDPAIQGYLHDYAGMSGDVGIYPVREILSKIQMFVSAPGANSESAM